MCSPTHPYLAAHPFLLPMVSSSLPSIVHTVIIVLVIIHPSIYPSSALIDIDTRPLPACLCIHLHLIFSHRSRAQLHAMYTTHSHVLCCRCLLRTLFLLFVVIFPHSVPLPSLCSLCMYIYACSLRRKYKSYVHVLLSHPTLKLEV